ncbi:hypothetical protein [Pinibacter aurantiacus]|uniref:DUF4304 domain-containing protein n=1 Tax=Pinibacter aurantiacus TaxID=2851599 RepID=A0A9E2SC61_9BACT|nr:hypothetical protein [Pinibacter aurantiacus]MBV4360291.1 hypothetical protein [Pinibacter aurantiacus]
MDAVFDHNKILKKIAKERLTPFGIIQQGKSRTFLYDNGWWIIIIEFQSSSWSKGSYLNIGLDFNFFPREHFAFTYGYREKSFEEVKDEKHFADVINEYCDFAIKKVAELRTKFADVWTASNTFKKQVDKDPWDNFELGILYGLTENLSKAKNHLQKVSNEKCEHNFEFERRKLVLEILTWLGDDETFLIKMKDLITQTRQLKKLSFANLDNLRTKSNNSVASSDFEEKAASVWNKIKRWMAMVNKAHNQT